MQINRATALTTARKLLWVLLTLFALGTSATAQSYSFSAVTIEGNTRVDPATILAYAALPKGTEISAAALNDAYQRIVNSGLFETVELDPQGGTLVIPGKGRISDEADVVEYRDMLTIVRDRVQALVLDNKTLAQVIAARPTADYDPIYGQTTGNWTTDNFVEAVFNSVKK